MKNAEWTILALRDGQEAEIHGGAVYLQLMTCLQPAELLQSNWRKR